MVGRRYNARLLFSALTSVAALLSTACAVSVEEVKPPSNSLKRLNCIAVLPFDNKSEDGRAGNIVAEMLASSLVTSEHYNIVEPTEVRHILEAQGYGYLPTPDLPTMQAYGRALGVDAVFVGSVAHFNNGAGNTIDEPQVAIASQLVEIRDGRKLWQGKVEYAREKGSLSPTPHAAILRQSVDSLVSTLVSERDGITSDRGLCAKSTARIAQERARPAHPLTRQDEELARLLPTVEEQKRVEAEKEEIRKNPALARLKQPSADADSAAPASSGGLGESPDAATAPGGAPTTPGAAPAVADGGLPGAAGGMPSMPGEAGGFPAMPGDAGGMPAMPGDAGGFPAMPGDAGGFPAMPGDAGGFPAMPGDAGGGGDLPPMPGDLGGLPALPGDAGGAGDLPPMPGDLGGFPAMPGDAGGGGDLPPMPGDLGGLPPMPGDLGGIPALPDDLGGLPPLGGAGMQGDSLPYVHAYAEQSPRTKKKLNAKQKRLLKQLFADAPSVNRLFVGTTTRLTPAANRLFKDLGKVMAAVPDMTIALEVHADTGNNSSSDAVSVKQLQVLKKAFFKKNPSLQGRVFFHQWGNRQPLTKDVTKRARKQNTRVDLRRVFAR